MYAPEVPPPQLVTAGAGGTSEAQRSLSTLLMNAAELQVWQQFAHSAAVHLTLKNYDFVWCRG